MPVPQNAEAIWHYLIGQGFTPNAAAGILGNMEQESGGNPMAGSNPPGRGLIQILGDPGGSLETELGRTMAYIRRNGSVADINAHASSPSSAAEYFSTKYERPDPAAANNPNRMASADAVASAARSGRWPKSAPGVSQPSDGGGGSIGIPGLPGVSIPISTAAGAGAGLSGVAASLAGIGNSLNEILKGVEWLFVPSHWVRIIAGVGGFVLVGAGGFGLFKAASGKTGDVTLAVSILTVAFGGTLLFIAFHNLPADVTSLPGMLDHLAKGIQTGSYA